MTSSIDREITSKWYHSIIGGNWYRRAVREIVAEGWAASSVINRSGLTALGTTTTRGVHRNEPTDMYDAIISAWEDYGLADEDLVMSQNEWWYTKNLKERRKYLTDQKGAFQMISPPMPAQDYTMRRRRLRWNKNPKESAECKMQVKGRNTKRFCWSLQALGESDTDGCRLGLDSISNG
jgi:hypothetical protein